jgi:hypothetical protein
MEKQAYETTNNVYGGNIENTAEVYIEPRHKPWSSKWLGVPKFTVHFDNSRIAIGDSEVVARKWVDEEIERTATDSSRYVIYEYIGGNPTQKASYRKLK